MWCEAIFTTAAVIIEQIDSIWGLHRSLGCPQVEERTVAQLLPFILPGLKDKSHAEYQLATFMLLMRLITRCSPGPQLFNGAWQCGHTQAHEQTGLHVCSVMSSIMKDDKRC